ncbi:MAG: DUF3841 domain-containing protein [Segetibacter sp.]
MKIDKKYRLWTFQSIRSIKELKNKGIIEASWDRYSETFPFIKSYEWMVKQMVIRKISCNNNAPIWAWHSCGKYENAPRLVDARCLLSDIELKDGIQTIELECPVELALLSNYGIWNKMLDKFISYKDEAKIDKKTEDMLFEIGRKKLRACDSIQATLPYLKLAWVKEIRELNLKPNDFSYNPEEEI